MTKHLPDPSRRSFVTRLTKSFLTVAQELNRLAEAWQGRNSASAIPPTKERAAAIDALLRLPNWHLIYLLTFDRPRPVEKVVPLPDFLAVPNWVELLGAEPLAVAEELQQLGALVRADLATHLIVRDFTRTELQTMLRSRQLPVSGNKEELMERLMQADGPGMWAALADFRLWECTPWAKDKANMRVEEVLAAKNTDEGQSATSAFMREVIKWVLLTAAGGVVSNRTDWALFGNDSAQSCDTDSTLPPDSPLPTPQPDTPVPEPQPEPQRQSTPHPRSTPIPPLAFDWVTIPAGEFWMGSDKDKDQLAYDNETPRHKVYLPTYRIARYPVTVAQFAQFIKATDYRTTAEINGLAWGLGGSRWGPITGADWAHPRGPDSHVRDKSYHPVTCVSWHDASAFCHWAGVRLPSEAEWEKAARGMDGRIYPWGNEPPDNERCNFNSPDGDTTPVDNYSKGQSFYNVLDMAGNVWEWTHSLSKAYPYEPDDGREDPTTDGRRVLRGVAFAFYGDIARCAFRNSYHPNTPDNLNGFRVAPRLWVSDF